MTLSYGKRKSNYDTHYKFSYKLLLEKNSQHGKDKMFNLELWQRTRQDPLDEKKVGVEWDWTYPE